jgi:CheY-like chemotaxis protein
MWAESTSGEGSTFHFSVVVDAQPQLVRHNWQAPQPELRGRRLLVVDDSETNRKVVDGLATAWGMTVLQAASPRAALEMLRTDAVCDVAVLDMHMPEMDGEALAAAIHAIPSCTHLPLVLLTSLGRRPQGTDFAQSLWKPVKADALFRAVRACVGPTPARVGGTSVAASSAYDPTLGQRCPLQVLVAEDNAVNQKVVNLLLQRMGYRCVIVANGLEAIAALELKPYDLILMDVEMPELDGCEATRRIRAANRGSIRPWIVALTASAMQNDRVRALDAGMNDFLTKPLRTDALTEAIVRAHAALSAT